MSGTSRIVSNPDVCGGRPIIAGTRMRVVDVLGMLAGGTTPEDILTDYPFLSHADIQACLAYAAEAVDHRIVRSAA